MAHPAVERVRTHAKEHGLDLDVRRYPAGTHTAEDAARAIGCEVAQIVKSLVFLAAGDPVVVLVAGSDRVDESKLAAVLGAYSARRATANEVRGSTGFVVGGVPPFGHRVPLPVVVDDALLRHEVVWAAAGLPDAVFPIAPAELVRLSGATEADVRL
ncbi:MAG: YbaK/EbsC family protein [Chloroflexi bacterium]|nr:YbaK/EbsC family protein [Chloroflexota bacterium]